MCAYDIPESNNTYYPAEIISRSGKKQNKPRAKTVIKNELKAHTILLPGGCIAAIVLTKQMAEDYASICYPNGSYRIVLTEEYHYKELKGSDMGF